MGTREEILKMAEDLQEKSKALSKEAKIFKKEMEEEVRRREKLASDMHNISLMIRKLLDEI